LERTLRSALALDSRTRGLELSFRSGAGTDLDMLLKDTCLLVNDKWWDFDTSHAISPCSLFLTASAENIKIDQFSCTHVLTELYDLILVELSKDSNTDRTRISETHGSLRLKITEKMYQMPCKVGVAPGDKHGQIDVTWIHPESAKVASLYGLHWKGRITLHRESLCSNKKLDLVAPGNFPVPSLFLSLFLSYFLTQYLNA
jgi:hypothetical protein